MAFVRKCGPRTLQEALSVHLRAFLGAPYLVPAIGLGALSSPRGVRNATPGLPQMHQRASLRRVRAVGCFWWAPLLIYPYRDTLSVKEFLRDQSCESAWDAKPSATASHSESHRAGIFA